jgi:hypothetical protein
VAYRAWRLHVSKRIDPHAVGERLLLLMHREYVKHLDRELIESAKSAVERRIAEGRETHGYWLWVELLQSKDPSHITAALVEDSPTARLLRSNSPLATLLDIYDESARRKLWRQAKAELQKEATQPPPHDDFAEKLLAGRGKIDPDTDLGFD